MLEMQRAFLDWLAREIAEALADETNAEPVRERTTLTPQADGQVSTGPDGTLRTGRQSNLLPRPFTPIATFRVAGRQRALGDTGRTLPPFEPTPKGIGIPPGDPISLPPPPMPALSPVCGVATGTLFDAVPGMAWRLAPDGLIDGNHERETDADLDGTVYPGETVNEPSGLAIGRPDVPPCDYESMPRFEHLAQRHRPSLRLPYMTGVDETGVFQREVRMPLKSCRLESLADWRKYAGGGGIPT